MMMEERLRSILQDATDRLPGLGAVDHHIIHRARRRVGTRAAVAAIAIITIVAGASAATTRLFSEESFGPAQQTRNAGWESIPAASIGGRAGHVAVSTGTEMLVWGGDNDSDDPAGLIDGSAFDYASGEWRPMSQAPLEVSGGRSGVWTGQEMLVWGGEVGDGSHDPPDDGAAYDPSSDSWRQLPASPSWSLAGHSAIWTGTEMIVWGGVGMEGRGAAFDPVAGSWRSLPPAPIEARFGHAAVWTGSEMIVWGGADGSGEPLKTGAAYDPATDAWRELPPAPLSQRDSPAAVWTGTEMIVWGGWSKEQGSLFDGASYDPASDSWRELPRSPISAYLPGTPVTWTGNEMIVSGAAGKLAMYAPSENGWAALPDPPNGPVVQPSLISQGGGVILWGGINHDEKGFSDEGALLRISGADEVPDEEERRPEQSEGLIEEVLEQTRAEIFAFRALAATELIDPYGKRSYNWTYEEDTTETTEGWRVGFAASDCEPRGSTFTCTGLSGEDPELGNAVTDTFVIVSLEGGKWRVVDVEGNILPEERQRVAGYTLSDQDEPSHWDFAAPGLWPTSEGIAISMMPIWVGPYPTLAPGSVCKVEWMDQDGKAIGEPAVFYQESPNRPFERGGWIRGGGVEPPPDVASVTVECRQYTGRGWEEVGEPELVGEPGAIRGVTAELEWRGDERFTAAAICAATLLDDEGDKVWDGSERVEPSRHESELKDYPYRASVFVQNRGDVIADAVEVGEFTCRTQ